MEREQIKKALECCTLGDCYPCPYGNVGAGCRDKMSEDALALIKSQEQRIKELTEENEKLRENCKPPIARNIDILKATTKADTVRAFAERLKELCVVDQMAIPKEQALWVIDQIAKEMLEGV